MTDPESLRRKIADEEARRARIDKERAEVLDRLKDLKNRPVGGSDASVPEPIPSDGLPFPSKIPSTTEEKVALFRSLFRGREDVFPKLWENAKTRRKGYAPACSNEWVRGVCEKPRVKCGKCSQRAFLPVTDQVVLDHLQGRHVIGVYPLRPDESCFLLAADFDGPSWKEDVAAFVSTCRRIGVMPAIERSRSGKGAHAWFFFSGPVPASTARQMGCHLITETMSHRHQLRMTSYDRLFPNQDTMPSGGFGNLIALPLQHKPRQEGNASSSTTISTRTRTSGHTSPPSPGSPRRRSTLLRKRRLGRTGSSGCRLHLPQTRMNRSRGPAPRPGSQPLSPSRDPCLQRSEPFFRSGSS